MEQPSLEHVYKILVLGEINVGKTSIVLQFTEGRRLTGHHHTTIGVDYAVKRLIIDDESVTLQLWDTAGQEAFRAIIRTLYRRADAVLFVYSLTDRRSFDALLFWVEEVWQHSGVGISLFLVGNKVDQEDKRQVEKHQAMEFAQMHGFLGFFETSADTAENIQEVWCHVGLRQDSSDS